MRSPETRTYQVTNLTGCKIGFLDCVPLLLERSSPPPVLTKRDFYRRFQNGEFGNHGPMWNSFEEWAQSGYEGEIAIRTRVKGGPCKYDLPRRCVHAVTNGFIRLGFSDLHYSAMSPHDRGLISGEVTYSYRGVELCYATGKMPMRDAMAYDARSCYGLEAVGILRRNVDASSFDWLMYLLDAYPDHIVEFTCFSVPWGVIPGLNTVIWEVRKY